MSSTKFIIGMRDAFFDSLYEFFKQDRNAVIIAADNGAPSLDKFAENFPDQFFTVGIAEQQMIGMACGMAFEGKKVYTYAIAPFVTLRCYEQNKLDMCAMNMPIVNLGVGAGYAYDIMGPSHHTVEDISIMRVLPNMVIHSPADSVTAQALARISYEDKSPQYIRFDRAGLDDLYQGDEIDVASGVILTKAGSDVTIVATGIMVHQALKISARLVDHGISAGVIDLCKLKPINRDLLVKHLGNVQRIVTLEEHLLAGGMGSAVLETLVDSDSYRPTLRIGQNDRFVFDLGGREAIWEKYGLDVESVKNKIVDWLE